MLRLLAESGGAPLGVLRLVAIQRHYFRAPLFLFLAGVSVALVTDKMRRKGAPRNQIAAKTIRRGGEIFALALLFRVQEFVLGWPWSPWTDLLRVDILNTIGLSIVLMGLVCWLARRRGANVILAAGRLRWGSRWPRRRSGPLPARAGCRGISSRISTACTSTTSRNRGSFRFFRGRRSLSRGWRWDLCCSATGRSKNPGITMRLLGAAGVAIYYISMWLDASPVHLYAVYDYWHTGPNFVPGAGGDSAGAYVLAGYAWCRWGAGQWGFSPLIQMGQTSLLVYWVHIEFVYGRFSILKKARRRFRRDVSACW